MLTTDEQGIFNNYATEVPHHRSPTHEPKRDRQLIVKMLLQSPQFHFFPCHPSSNSLFFGTDMENQKGLSLYPKREVA
jgi:hypothetical protein